jgi:hypothetical protein
MSKRVRLLCLCLCIYVTNGLAAADPRCTLKTLAAVDLAMREPGPLVPAIVDGHPVWLVLRTDSGITEFFPPAVAELGLHTETLSADIEAKSGGKSVKAMASIQSFAIAGLRLPKKFAWVDPSTEAAATAAIDGRTVLGSLGMDVLWPYDFELDPTRGKLTLYAQNHCGARAVYWPGTVQRLDVQVAPMGNFFFSVDLNGKSIEAAISVDTPWTFLRADVARRLFGVSMNDSELAVTQLTAGPLTLKDTHIRLVRPPANLNYCTALTDERPTGAAGFNDCLSGTPLTLGLDIVGKLRMYFATRDRAIYFTSNDELTAMRATDQPRIR